MRPDFPGFIILFYGLSSPPDILLLQVAQNLHPALRVDVFLSRGITCRTGQTGVGKCAGLHLHCAMGICSVSQRNLERLFLSASVG